MPGVDASRRKFAKPELAYVAKRIRKSACKFNDASRKKS